MKFDAKLATLALSAAAVFSNTTVVRAESIDPAAERVVMSGPQTSDVDFSALAGQGEIVEAPARSVDCGPRDPDCRRHLKTLLNEPKILHFEAGAGVFFGESEFNAAVNVSAQGVNLDSKSGDARLLVFDTTLLYAQDMVRVRFTLADSQATFICRGSEGGITIPGVNAGTNCKLEGVKAYLGAGGTLVQVQGDTATKRVAARWFEIHAVLNLLGNANDATSAKNFLNRRLLAHAGASVDTIWFGDTPGTHGGSKTILRGNFGFTGMLRTDNMRWELRAIGGYRPNMIDFSDYAIQARAQVLYNVLVGPPAGTDGTTGPINAEPFRTWHVGLDTQYQYNTRPERSIGDYASDRMKHSTFIGAVLGFTL